MELYEKCERRESFLFSMVQHDFALQKTKIFLENKLLWLCPRAHRSMPKIQGNRKDKQGIQVFMSYFLKNVFLLKPFLFRIIYLLLVIYTSSAGGKRPTSTWCISITPKHLSILPCTFYSTQWDWHTKNKQNTAGVQKEKKYFL